MDLVLQSDVALNLPMVLNGRKFHFISLGQKEEWFELLSLAETFSFLAHLKESKRTNIFIYCKETTCHLN